MKKKIYSYIEAAGHTLRPPRVEGPDGEVPEYLACIDGRHYVAFSGSLPAQAPAIRLEGPIDLSADPALHRALIRLAAPWSIIRRRRSEEYPDIGDQLDALAKEFARRRERGEELTPELDELIDRCRAVKARHPKPDIGL